MARSTSRIYDPATGKWVKSVTTVDNQDKDSNSGDTNKSENSLSSNNSDSDSSTGSAEKEYNTINYNILTLNVSLVPTKEVLKIKAGDTIYVGNLGKTLTGKYYVQGITFNNDSNGLSVNATLYKTDFGSNVKYKSTGVTKEKEDTVVTESITSSKGTLNKYHTLAKGETLWGLAYKYYKDGSKYTKIAEANNIEESKFKYLKIGTKLLIP